MTNTQTMWDNVRIYSVHNGVAELFSVQKTFVFLSPFSTSFRVSFISFFSFWVVHLLFVVCQYVCMNIVGISVTIRLISWCSQFGFVFTDLTCCETSMLYVFFAVGLFFIRFTRKEKDEGNSLFQTVFLLCCAYVFCNASSSYCRRRCRRFLSCEVHVGTRMTIILLVVTCLSCCSSHFVLSRALSLLLCLVLDVLLSAIFGADFMSSWVHNIICVSHTYLHSSLNIHASLLPPPRFNAYEKCLWYVRFTSDSFTEHINAFW